MSDNTNFTTCMCHLKHQQKIEELSEKMMVSHKDVYLDCSSTIDVKIADTSESKYITKLAYYLENVVQDDGEVQVTISNTAYEELSNAAQDIAFKFNPQSDEDFVFDYTTQLKIYYASQRLGRFAESYFAMAADLVDDIIALDGNLELVGVLDTLSEYVIESIKRHYTELINSTLLEAVVALLYNTIQPDPISNGELHLVYMESEVDEATNYIIDNISVVFDDIITDAVIDAFEDFQESEKAIKKVTEEMADITL
jgi:hypothetical protein